MKMSTWGRQWASGLSASSPRTPRKSAVVSAPVRRGRDAGSRRRRRRRCRAARSGRRGARHRSQSITSHGTSSSVNVLLAPGTCHAGRLPSGWIGSIVAEVCTPSLRTRCDASTPSACSARTGSRRSGRGRCAPIATTAAHRGARGRRLVPPAVPAGVMRISSRIRLCCPRGSSIPGGRGRRRCRCRHSRPAGATRAARRSCVSVITRVRPRPVERSARALLARPRRGRPR